MKLTSILISLLIRLVRLHIPLLLDGVWQVGNEAIMNDEYVVWWLPDGETRIYKNDKPFLIFEDSVTPEEALLIAEALNNAMKRGEL